MIDNDYLIQAYRALFTTPGGHVVLNDLMKFCNFRIPVNDPIEEGKRRVFLRIVEFMSFEPDEIMRIYAGRTANPMRTKDGE